MATCQNESETLLAVQKLWALTLRGWICKSRGPGQSLFLKSVPWWCQQAVGEFRQDVEVSWPQLGSSVSGVRPSPGTYLQLTLSAFGFRLHSCFWLFQKLWYLDNWGLFSLGNVPVLPPLKHLHSKVMSPVVNTVLRLPVPSLFPEGALGWGSEDPDPFFPSIC